MKRKSISNKSRTSQLRMSETPYDLAVIGAGPVGAQAAMVAASPPYSKKVVLIDAPRASGMLMNGEEDLSIGGPTGLFSKALRDTSKQIKVSTLRGMGLREESVWNEVIGNCVDLASSNAQDCFRQLDFCGVDYVRGFASFPDSGGSKSLIVTNEDHSIQTIRAENTLIATGSMPFRPEGIPFDGTRIFDSDSINQVRRTIVAVMKQSTRRLSCLTIISLLFVLSVELLAKVDCHYGLWYYCD